jgi:hypothetical protein
MNMVFAKPTSLFSGLAGVVSKDGVLVCAVCVVTFASSSCFLVQHLRSQWLGLL